MSIVSSLQSIAQVTDPGRSFWGVELTTGRQIFEQSLQPARKSGVFDTWFGGFRGIDWSLDIVATGDIYKVKTLSLYCPNGLAAHLAIDEPGTCFQFKIASMPLIVAGPRQVECQIIGKVLSKEEGTCMCWIWDLQQGLIDYRSSIYTFGSWRPGILPIAKISQDVIGLRLH